MCRSAGSCRLPAPPGTAKQQNGGKNHQRSARQNPWPRIQVRKEHRLNRVIRTGTVSCFHDVGSGRLPTALPVQDGLPTAVCRTVDAAHERRDVVRAGCAHRGVGGHGDDLWAVRTEHAAGEWNTHALGGAAGAWKRGGRLDAAADREPQCPDPAGMHLRTALGLQQRDRVPGARQRVVDGRGCRVPRRS